MSELTQMLASTLDRRNLITTQDRLVLAKRFGDRVRHRGQCPRPRQ